MALGYKIALTNVWWKRGGQDIRLFANTTEQQTYFSNLGLYWNDLVNFNIKDNITTTIVFKDKSGRDAETLLKCNYAVVWNTKANTYRYYFIVSIEQDSSNQVLVSLDLDDVNTNLVPNLSKNWSVFVERWTGLNYVFDGNDIYYKFDDDRISYLPQGDAPLLKNIGTNDVKIKQYNNSAIDNWLFENVKAWKYLFLVENQKLVSWAYQDTSFVETIEAPCFNKIKSTDRYMNNLPYNAIAVPFYQTSKRIYIKYNVSGSDHYLLLDPIALAELVNIQGYVQGESPQYNNNPLGTYGIEEKLSNISPIYLPNTYEIDNDGDLILTGLYNDIISNAPKVSTGGYSLYYITEQDSVNNLSKATATRVIEAGYYQQGCTYDAEAYHNLPIAPLTQNNVKFFDKEYSRLRLRIGSQTYDYNPLLLITSNTQTTIDLQYTEVLKVGVSKIYLRAKASGKYTSSQQYDYTGLIASLDLTEPLLTNQWADYLASHKNYYMQTTFNNCLGIAQGTIGALGTGNNYKATLGVVNTGVNYIANIVNQEFDKDNMQQAPVSLSNANGDPYFSSAVDSIRPKLDSYYIATNQDAISSNWERYGILYNRGFTLGEVIAKHYKYDALSCIIDIVVDNMSNKEYDRLKAYMSKVHRYWHVETDTLAENFYVL